MSSNLDSERNSTEQAKQDLHRARAEAGQLASSAAEAARARGRDEADNLKRRAAERAEAFADALDTTADELESSEGGRAVSGYGHNMASMVRRFAGGLKEQEIEDFATQLVSFARRNPGSFLAGSVALGFGLSRFMKASSDRPSYEYSGRDEYGFEDDGVYDDEYLFDDGLDTTLEPAASPEVSTYTAGDRWPEDRGNERPGAASPSQHTSPGADGQPQSEYRAGATGDPAGSRGSISAEGNVAGDRPLGDGRGGDSTRNQGL